LIEGLRFHSPAKGDYHASVRNRRDRLYRFSGC
jgi:hypothetical protein